MSMVKYTFILLCVLVGSTLAGCNFLPEVTEVRLSDNSVTLQVNQSRTITDTVGPAAAKYESISWTISDILYSGLP